MRYGRCAQPCLRYERVPLCFCCRPKHEHRVIAGAPATQALCIEIAGRLVAPDQMKNGLGHRTPYIPTDASVR